MLLCSRISCPPRRSPTTDEHRQSRSRHQPIDFSDFTCLADLDGCLSARQSPTRRDIEDNNHSSVFAFIRTYHFVLDSRRFSTDSPSANSRVLPNWGPQYLFFGSV